MRRIMISFPLAFILLPPAHPGGTILTVFRPVGARQEKSAALAAPSAFQPVVKGRFQLVVQRQHRRTESAAEQGVGNALDTDSPVRSSSWESLSAVGNGAGKGAQNAPDVEQGIAFRNWVRLV